MARLIEFAGNHPFLTAAAVTLMFVIVMYEFRRATRGYREVEPAEAPRLINHDEAVLVDVRAAADFEKGHILNALNVPAGEVKDKLDVLLKHAGKPLIVYCGTGITSGRAATELVLAGLQPVFNLKGGLSAWETAGLPVVRKKN